mgnify:CR=1 FL=1
MSELLRSNDAILLGYVEVVLRQLGIACLIADQHISVIEGSIGAFPRRLLVAADDLPAARRALQEAGAYVIGVIGFLLVFPLWGVTIIGVSGLMMWLPGLTGALLPGWVFNVAAIFHGEEAFLAVVFLFTVHFFNNHFRPDKFPVEIVMFTGTMSLEHYRREHALEYQRMVDSGELEKHLVDAPSAPMTLASKLLGFVLIAFGLTLLAGVAIGFFSGA